jgi:glyceraldehyde-3-phosphate dehydrogenase (NAD(P))
MVNIVVNGIGTIGKRVAEAVDQQEDMNLRGLSDVSPSPQLRTILSEDGPLNGTPLYASSQGGLETLRRGEMHVEGTLQELLELDEVDLVVDCTPPGIDEQNKEEIYKKYGVKAIFQGGADPSIAPVAFNADANYDDARGEDFVKVVSCNTTSLSRTMQAIDSRFGVDEATANLVRRGGDPAQDSRGPINSIIPVTEVPSHHGPDVQEVMPELDIKTLAVKVPTTISHVHMVNVKLDENTTEERVLDAFRDQPRVVLQEANKGYSSTGKVMEKMRDMERPRNDLNEASVWKETVTVDGKDLYWIHQVHQEAIVVPDNVDAIRSMFEIEDQDTSIQMTNDAMNIE